VTRSWPSAIPVGRWLDRHGGRALMTTGSAAGTVLLVLLSTVHNLAALYAVWIGIGLAVSRLLMPFRPHGMPLGRVWPASVDRETFVSWRASTAIGA